jgi:chorismate synthase
MGQAFRVTTFGESHGGGLGVVIDGCPPGVALDVSAIQAALHRRRPGQSKWTTSRQEPDEVRCLSGMFEGETLGTPLCFVVDNKDADPEAYRAWKEVYRPSHGDYTYEAKYGRRAWAGGGRASARETVARVIAGDVARQVLATLGSVDVVAWVDRLHEVVARVDVETVSLEAVEGSELRCPDEAASAQMVEAVSAAMEARDTVGGVIACVLRGVPAGLGEPVFDKLDAALAAAMMSIPATKGFEIGSGFEGTRMKGSEHNDRFVELSEQRAVTQTNRSGGIQAGISNGMPIVFSVAFKPVSTLPVAQATVNRSGEPTTVDPKGRHDPCVLPRAVPIVEAMANIVLLDHWLRWRGQVGSS